MKSDVTYEIETLLKSCTFKYHLKDKICKHSLGYSNIHDLMWFGDKFHSKETLITKEKRGRKKEVGKYKRLPYAEKAGKALLKF